MGIKPKNTIFVERPRRYRQRLCLLTERIKTKIEEKEDEKESQF
jgi:hypothetical protein